jgi:hypothetical protein
MSPAGFEPTILVSEQPKTHVLDRTATGIGFQHFKYLTGNNNSSIARRKS